MRSGGTICRLFDSTNRIREKREKEFIQKRRRGRGCFLSDSVLSLN